MPNNHGATVQLAERVLSSAFNSPVHLMVEEELDSRHLVLRCNLVTACDGAPTSILLKQMAVDAPPDQPLHPLDCFLNELANLRFFNEVRDRVAFGPRLYGWHRGAGLLLIEDLGDHQNLKAILRGSDPRLATDALLKFGQCLGKVQVATLGQAGALTTSPGDARAPALPSIARQDLRSAMGELHACLDTLRIQPPAGFDRALEKVEAAIHDGDSPFRTWTHCDLRPLNILYLASTQVQLVDLELASFGHALLDAVCVRMAFPPPPAPFISAGQCVPRPVIQRFENSYRAELIRGFPEAADDACFQEALVQACAHWAWIKLLSMWQIHLRQRLAEGKAYEDREEIAPHKALYARFRQQGVAYLQTFVDTAAEFEQLPALRAAAERVVAALLGSWPEIQPLPYFPAF